MRNHSKAPMAASLLEGVLALHPPKATHSWVGFMLLWTALLLCNADQHLHCAKPVRAGCWVVGPCLCALG